MVRSTVYNADFERPSTWVKYRPSLCHGCHADCCRLPVEITASDLVRMGLVTEEETTGSLKRVARRLERDGITSSFRGRTGLFTLNQTHSGDCIYLDANRRCRIYETRPDVCRQFPEIGPRPGFCPCAKP